MKKERKNRMFIKENLDCFSQDLVGDPC